jgi:hypothetical protein
MVRQAAVLGLENQINLEQITPCGCTNVTQLTKGWQGTMNFNFAGQGSHTYPNGPTTTSASIQTSFSVTSPLAHALTEGAFFYPYETDPNVMAWDTGPSNPSGTASMNDQTEQKDPSNDVTDTNIGSGPPVTDRVGNLSYVRVVFSPKTCLYALTVGINVVATQTVLPGGQPFTAPQNLVILYLPDFSLPPPNQGTTISGSSSVLVYALNNAGGPHDPYVIPDGSEIGVLGQVSGDNGQPNLGSATVNWSFTPIP